MLRIRPARTVDLPGMAAVLSDAFGDKLGAIFSPEPDTVRRLLEAIYAGPVRRGYDGVLVADRGGRVVGTLVIEPVYHTQEENRRFESLAVRELGLPRVLRAGFLLWLTSHTPDDGEAHVGDVGVAPDCQRQGIGTQLLLHAEHWARDHNRQRLTLWVAATNSGAIALYEKAGYRIKRTRSSWLTRLALGVRHWHFMEKTLETTLPVPVASGSAQSLPAQFPPAQSPPRSS